MKIRVKRLKQPLSLALIVFGSLAGFCLLLRDGVTSPGAQALNYVVPLVIVGTCSIIAASLLQAHRFNILSPIPWFYLASALFFGIGPLVFVFGNDETINMLHVLARYEIDEFGLLHANTLVLSGLFLVTLTILITKKFIPWNDNASTITFQNFDVARAEIALTVFVVIGAVIKYIFVLPYLLRLVSWTLPGVVQQLSMMLPAAIIIAMLLANRGFTKYRIWLYLLITSETISSLLTFAKTSFLYVMISILIGRFLCQKSIRSLVVSMVALALFSGLILNPFVLYARKNVDVKGTLEPTVLIDTINEFLRSGVHSEGEQSDQQGWWMRLSYANFQKWSIDSYANGLKGDSLEAAYTALLPRTFFPDKREYLDGAVFSDLLEANLSARTRTDMSFFAEGYWNGGPWGLMVVCAWTGIVLSGFTRFAFSQLGSGRLSMLLPMLIGITVGIGPQFWWVPTYVGGVGIAGVYALLLWFFLGRTAQRQRTSSSIGR